MSRLASKPLVIDHLLYVIGDGKYVISFIVGAVFLYTVCYVYEGVESYHVGGAKGGRFGMTNNRAGKFIDFFDGEVEVFEDMRHVEHGKYTYAVGDKCGCVFTEHGFFSEEARSVFHEEIDDFRVGFGVGDYFEQAQVTGRVEEVCSAEMFLEIFAASFAHQVDGDTRGVGSDEGTRLAVFFYFVKNLLFDVEALYDYFDDPVHFADFVEVVVEVTGADAAGKLF